MNERMNECLCRRSASGTIAKKRTNTGKDQKTFVNDRMLERFNAQTSHKGTPNDAPLGDVLAVMPFYATPGGDAGHSSLFTRRSYLRITVESLRPVFPRILVCVASDFDFDYVKSEFNDTSKISEVMKYKAQLFRPSRLGFATIYLSQYLLLKDPRFFDVRYVFYTESDQILRARSPSKLLDLVGSGHTFFLIPHRVQPVPVLRDFGETKFEVHRARSFMNPDHIKEFAKNDAKPTVHHVNADLKNASCCFDRNPCSTNRERWRRFGHPDLELFQIKAPTRHNNGDAPTHHPFNDSLVLVAGEGNFLRQSFRICKLGPPQMCPW
mmetsp:Transcript_10965/g.36299  ORF Transcript_10965/g.36299 Transcript_10965/m.36299 type:complete len:324 (+) Transcript_10965:96-1067(+)